MKIKAEKRLLAMLMVVIMVISFIPVNALAATLFTTTVLDGKVSISGDGTSNLGTGTNTNDVVTITAKPEVNSCTGAITPKDHTVTVTNATADETLTLSFNYEASNFGGFTVAGTDKSAAPKGSWGGQLAPGATLTIVLTSPATETEATLVLSSFELQDDSAKTVTVQPGANGTVQVNGTAITAVTEVTTTFAEGVTLTAAPASGYVFLGWVDSNYNILASETTAIIQPKTDMAVYAAFVANDQTAYWQGGGKLHTDLDAAITAAQASDGLVVLLKNATLSGSYTIPAGVTLLIPHDEAQTMYGANPAMADNGTKWAVPSAYRTLTLADNAKLTVNGTMELAAMHYIASGSQTTGGQVYGKFAHVVLGENSAIDVNGTLYTWGYITGDGVVTAYSGGTIYEKMQITDYRGGTNTSLLAITHKSKKLFPFSQYYCQNVEAKEVIHAGATLMAHAGVYVSAPESSAIAFVGDSSAMFGLASGYVVKTYDAERDRLCIDVYGNASLNSISLSVGDQSISSADFRLGINNNISLGIHSGVTQINQDLVLQAGVEVTIDREATLYNTKEVYVMDAEDWGTFARAKTIIPVNWTVANGSKVIRTSVTDAVVDINGTILNGGQIYTTGSESVISSEKTGVLILQTSPNSTGTLYFVTDNVRDNIMTSSGSAWTTVDCTAAVLVNGDGSTVTMTGVQYDSYIYDSFLDQWISKNIYNEGAGYTPVLSFDANGGTGSVASLNIPFLNIAGAFAQTGVMQPLSVALPDSSFVRDGYTFIGWSANNAATGADFIPGDYVVFSQDHTLYAVWSANKYALVIDGVSQEVPFGSDLSTYIPAAPTKDGYTFAGWTVTTADGTSITAPTTMPAYDIIFTANWEQVKSYTLTFLDENGDILEEYSYEAGQQVTATYPAYTKDNYVITWNADIPATLTGDVEISAIATPNVYTITFVSEGVEIGDDAATESNNWTVSLLQPTKTGYEFMGWAYASDVPAADITADVAELALTGDVTLYAVWAANAYTVTFNGVGEPIVVTCAYGDGIPVPNDPEMEGYTFTGWANRVDGSGVPATMPAEDLIFDAQWEQIVYTLSWDVDGDGNVDSTTSVAHNGYVGTLPEAVVPGMTATTVYTLSGWTDANGATVDASTVVTGDMTITANIVASDRYYYLAGLIGGEWGEVEANKMIPNGDGTYTLEVRMEPGTYEFKVRSGDAWYGCNTTIVDSTNGNKYYFYGDAYNCGLQSTGSGVYTFTWDTADNSLIVDYVPDHVHVYNATFNWSNYNTACEVTLTCDCNSSFTYACGVTASEDGNQIVFTATYKEYSDSVSVDNNSTRAIYFDNSNTNWGTVYAYCWNSNNDIMESWPGTPMTKVEGTDNLYAIIVPADYQSIIFNNGDGTQCEDQAIPTNGCNVAVWYSNSDVRWGYNEPAQCTITFEVDGQQTDAYSFYYGEIIDWSEIDENVVKPEQEGYTFSGYDYSNAPAYVNGDITITGSLTINTYTITWIVDGVEYEETYNYGDMPEFTGSTDKAPDAEYTYYFDCWSPEVEEVTGDATYTAIYSTQGNWYAITFYVEGAQWQKVAYRYGTELPWDFFYESFGTPEKEGYTFAGWVDAEGNPIPDTMPAHDVEAYAVWTINTYTVTFSINGEIYTTTDFVYGSVVTAPEYTAPEGYTFSGWNVPATMPAENITLDATLSINSYTVTWIVDGVETQETYNYGEIPVFTGSTDKAPTAEYTYTFDGWDSEVTAVTGDATYTAQYKATANTYTITFSSENGLFADVTIQVAYGQTVTADMVPNTEFEHYEFVYWNDLDTNNIVTFPMVMPARNMRIMCLHSGVYYQAAVNFENGAEADWLDYYYEQYVHVALYDLNYYYGTPEREGYTFIGWEFKDGNTGYVYQENDQLTTDNLSITALWEANTYTVTFSINGEIYTTTDFVYGSVVTAPEYTAPEGYTFSGWNVPATMPAENITLDATLSINSYTVTWIVDGVETQETYNYGETPVFTGSTDKAQVGCTVYTFAGWDNEIVAVNGNATYTATYTESLSHTEGETVEYVLSEGDCQTEGEKQVIVYCSACGGEISNEIVFTGYGDHDWQDATCTEAKRCGICGETEGEALGHSYSATGYEWSADYSSCTVTGTCATCGGTTTEIGYSAVTELKPANCVAPAYLQFIAGFNAEWAETQTTEAYDPAEVFDPNVHAFGTRYIDNGDGTHTEICAACNTPLAEPINHRIESNIIYSQEGNCVNQELTIYKCTTCYAQDEVYGDYDYSKHPVTPSKPVDNGDGTHTMYYTCCNAPSDIVVEHTFAESNGTIKCVCGALYNGIFEDANGDLYFVENGAAVENKGLVQAIDENGLKIYYYFGCGIEGCSAGDACQGNFKAQKSCRHYAGITNGYLVEGGYTIGDDGIIEHTENLQGIQTLDGTKYYLIDGVKVAIGLVKVDGEYYYARSNGALVIGQDYYISKTNGLTYNGEAITKGSYTFDADGKIVWAEPKNGIYAEDGSLYYYVDGVRNYAGLIIYTGDLNNADGTVTEGVYDNAMIYVNTKGEVKNSCTYWISKNNGLIEKNRAFTFDANGIVVEDEKNGFYFEDGFWYYYVDGSKNYAGLIWCDGPEGNDPGYYYINSKCQLITNCTYWISKNNGYMSNQAYIFGANGKMEQVTNDSDELLNGFVEENGELYYYENGIKTYAGLILVDGNYYYVNSKCQVIRDCTYWISKNNGYMKNGSYTFDANGVMVTE